MEDQVEEETLSVEPPSIVASVDEDSDGYSDLSHYEISDQDRERIFGHQVIYSGILQGDPSSCAEYLAQQHSERRCLLKLDS